MIDTVIHVAIRSYKRAGLVKTIEIVPFAWIWVCESEEAEYREWYGDRVVAVPDEEDGGLARKNNAILDRSPCEWTMILDDDITRIGYWEAGGRVWMDADQIEGLIENGFIMADDLGVKMWGINQNRDELLYNTYCPINLLSPILGPFTGHLKPELRYDDLADGKDDYDYWLQNIQKHHKTLRLNRYHYDHGHGSNRGGFVSMRTMSREIAAVQYMRKKWGDAVFKEGGSAGGKSSTGKNILNSRIRIPIKGC